MLGFVLALFAFGCSKNEAATNLGVIDLAPNTSKHFEIGGVDWTITKTLLAGGKQTITAESILKVTQKDIDRASVPPNTPVGAIIKRTQDMSGLPAGVEITGYFGNKLARYILKRDTN